MVWQRGTPWPWPPSRHGELNASPNRPRLAYTPDGRSLVFLPSTGDVRLYDAAAKRPLAVGRAKGNHPVIASGFAQEGSRLWCCDSSGRVFALTLPGLQEETSWSVPTAGEVTAAAFSDDAARLAVGDAAGVIGLYPSDPRRAAADVASAVLGATRSPLHALAHLGRPNLSRTTLTDLEEFGVTELAWSPDGSRLAAGRSDETVHVWDVERARHVWSANAFGQEVRWLQFHPTQGWLFGGAPSTGAGLWNAETGSPILRLGAGRSGGFTEDGATLASGGSNGVSFIDFHIPDAVRTLHGSSRPSYHRAWSRDGRHLASLDVRSVENAALALSDDGRYLAYASGGDEHGWLVLRDVREHSTAGTWQMKGGFETIGYSQNRFWLVREEDEGKAPYLPWPKPRPVHSVAYELEVGKGPRRLGVLRHSEAADERRFLDHALSPDGRYYLWVGPRFPYGRQRVEVHDVRAGRRLASEPCSGAFGREMFPAHLDPHGRRFVMGVTEEAYQVRDLPSGTLAATVPTPSWLSGDGRWEV